MKTLTLIVLALALSYATPHAQGRGHAYGHMKHEERFESTRPGPAVRVYSAPRVYTSPRVYYYQPRPSVSLSFPSSGYSTYQPYGTYYYPNGYLATRRAQVRRREHDEHARRFAHERQER